MGPKATNILRKVPRIVEKVLLTKIDYTMPVSRYERGKHSAAYTADTGSIPIAGNEEGKKKVSKGTRKDRGGSTHQVNKTQ